LVCTNRLDAGVPDGSLNPILMWPEQRMSIERQISQYDNPQEFTRLCNAVFVAKYGDGYQVIDGSREDGGNDGYVSAEKRMLAIYCPMKPEQRTDADYLKKIRGDLAKAIKLRDSGQYRVEHWTFVTPRKLSNDVIGTMIAEAREQGLTAVQKDAAFLALEICERPHIKLNFPELVLIDVGEFLKAHGNIDAERTNATRSQDTAALESESFVAEPEGEPGDDYKRVMAVRKSPEIDPEQAKVELRALIYQSTDAEAQLNAIFGIADLFAPDTDDIPELLSTCERGLVIAKAIASVQAEAVLRAFMGYVKSFLFGMQELQYLALVRMNEAVGIELFSVPERKAFIKDLQASAEEYQREFSQAAELTKQSGNPHVYVTILSYFANAAGQRAGYLQMFESERAVKERELCKRMLLAVKDFCADAGDQLGAANALFNLANQIRFFGEEKEALQLLPGIRRVAEKYGDRRLLLKLDAMEERLRTG
jgi:hypothetical protein